MDVCLSVLLVHGCIRFLFATLDITIDEHDFVDGQEGISEGKDTDDQDDHESQHVIYAGHDHADKPAELADDPQLEQESEPEEQGSPSLN